MAGPEKLCEKAIAFMVMTTAIFTRVPAGIASTMWLINASVWLLIT